ncbi:hypothetical protein TPSD3_01085 [Thioflexithrix psekupsensis]|uniref:DUF1828 domain-containing protein n=2 Tax=Thioflexithrix psekupsensis TaxID=1570016 RepID=A0A251XBY1_9GAMM|nr:hypothetical protein TPSD3_01085 [Thioflexithrix psekupsensis]
MINCCELFKNLGFTAEKTKGCDGSDVLRITTPSTFSDGQPVFFYLINNNEKIQLTDDASTLFKFVKDGYEMKNRWKSIYSIIDKYELNRNNGEIYIDVDNSNLWQGFGQFIACVNEIINYEKGLHIAQPTLDFVEMVAAELEKIAPIQERNPVIIGGSHKEYTFNFKQNDRYVDAVPVHPTSTGHLLRKLVDIRLAQPELDILIVLNDNNVDKNKIDKEMLVLSSMASVIDFTDLKQLRVH